MYNLFNTWQKHYKILLYYNRNENSDFSEKAQNHYIRKEELIFKSPLQSASSLAAWISADLWDLWVAEYSDQCPLSRASPTPAELCCCPRFRHGSPSLSGLQSWLWLFSSPAALFDCFSPLFILSWSPGTAQIRASTWGCHFCLKEM